MHAQHFLGGETIDFMLWDLFIVANSAREEFAATRGPDLCIHAIVGATHPTSRPLARLQLFYARENEIYI